MAPPLARAGPLLLVFLGRLLWTCACALELAVSTALHVAFAAFIMHCAVTQDVLALLPNLLRAFSIPSSSSPSPPSSSSASSSGSSSAQPSSPSTPDSLPASPSFWPSSPGSGPSYSYLMSCSVLFSSPSAYPFRLAAWLKRSASSISSTLSWPSSPSVSGELGSNPAGSSMSRDTSFSSLLYQQETSRSGRSGRSTSLLQLDVPSFWRYRDGTIDDGASDADEDSGDELGVGEREGSSRRQGSEGGRDAPIVLLHGLFGFGHGRLGRMSYFGGVERQHEGVYVPDLGSLTSLHDRARRLFYYLKGGTVDYGEEHSTDCGHDRFGMTLPGQHRNWDEAHPVHLVGHSAGVQVARLLQQMLADKEFEGYDTNADWVASITSLSGALNGTTRVYIDGLQPEDGETLMPMCLLQVLRVGVLLYEFMDIPWARDYYSFGFEHFGMAWHKGGLRLLWNTLVRGATGPFSNGDWILPDLSIQRSLHLNRSVIQTHPNTYYFSYATVGTQQMRVLGQNLVLPAGPSTVHPLFTLRCLQMSLWTFPASVPRPYKGFRDEEWQHNDGALNVISMLYPLSTEANPESSLGSSQPKKKKSTCANNGACMPIPHAHAPMPVRSNSQHHHHHHHHPQPSHHGSSPAQCSLPSCRGFPVHSHPENEPFSPGIWYYSLLEADHILFIISPRRAGVHFDILYRSIFKRCRNVGPSLSMKRSQTVPALSHVTEEAEGTPETDSPGDKFPHSNAGEKEEAVAAKAQVHGAKKALRWQSKSQSAGDVRGAWSEGVPTRAVPSGDSHACTVFEAINLSRAGTDGASAAAASSSSSAVPCGAGSCSGSDCECLQGRTTSESSGGLSREGSDVEDGGEPSATRAPAKAFLPVAYPAELSGTGAREAGGNGLWGEGEGEEEEEEQWADAQATWGDAETCCCDASTGGACEEGCGQLRLVPGATGYLEKEAPCAPFSASASPEVSPSAGVAIEPSIGAKARYGAFASVANRVNLDRWKRRKRRGHGRPVSPFFCAGIPHGM